MFIADSVILLSAFIWGADYIIAKDALLTMPPGWLNAIRFTVSAVLLAIFGRRRIAGLSRKEYAGCALTGLCMFGGFFFQTNGLKYSSVGNSAFIVSAYVIIVPFILWLIQRERPSGGSFLGAALCVVGIGLLALDSNFMISRGDGFTLCAAFCFAFEIVLIGRYAKRLDPLALAFIEAVVVAICFDIYAPIFEQLPPPPDIRLILSMLYLTFLGAIATHIMITLAMKHTSTVHASLLCSMESVFGIIMAVIFLGDVLSAKMITGCSLVFLAVVVVEAWEVQWKRRS